MPPRRHRDSVAARRHGASAGASGRAAGGGPTAYGPEWGAGMRGLLWMGEL